MSMQWYFQVMGAEFGPLTSAELKEKVQIGQIQPDTLVRSGQDGKWIPADRWKGLLPAKEDTPEPPPASPLERSTLTPVNRAVSISDTVAAGATSPKPGFRLTALESRAGAD